MFLFAPQKTSHPPPQGGVSHLKILYARARGFACGLGALGAPGWEGWAQCSVREPQQGLREREGFNPLTGNPEGAKRKLAPLGAAFGCETL